MKKPDNIEIELDEIRKQLQKEDELLTTQEAVDKINKIAGEVAKEFGLTFLNDLKKSSAKKLADESSEYTEK